jgi:hypothetical protein
VKWKFWRISSGNVVGLKCLTVAGMRDCNVGTVVCSSALPLALLGRAVASSIRPSRAASGQLKDGAVKAGFLPGGIRHLAISFMKTLFP